MDGEVLMGTRYQAPGNVTAPLVGAEAAVVGRDRWEYMHQLRTEGRSVSEIARLTDVDRKTVRSCLARSEWRPYRREPVAQTLLGAHMAWLIERAPRVHYSARILFQELRRDRGGCPNFCV